MITDWPLVGRDEELHLLMDLVRSDRHHGVVLAGAAGVGKSRLAAECLAQAERAGLPTARVAATRSAAHLPFGALSALLPPAEDVGVAQDQAAFLRRCCAALAERGDGRRLVLFVDDAHALDDASATLVHQAAETDAAFVLSTVRTGEAAPDAVVALWKDGLAERLDLATLAVDVIEELLSAALGGPVERATVARLAARCQGNALFLRELVLGAVSVGALVNEGDLWRLVGSPPPSDRLLELIEARLSGLSDAERSLLERVALAEPLGSAELEALSDPSLVNSLSRRALLSSRIDGRRLEVRLAHPLHGEALRTRMPALRARTLIRNLADVVEATGTRRREDTLRVATWRLDGGGDMRAELMLAAAWQARTRWDLALAERLARAAFDAEANFDAAAFLGQVLFLQGHCEEAERHLSGLVPTVTDDSQRSTLAVLRLDNLVLGLGRPVEALRVAAEAEASIRDVSARDAVTVKRSHLLWLAGQTRSALELVEPLLERAEDRTLVSALITAEHCLGRVGRLAEAVDASERASAAHAALSGPPLPHGPYVHVAYRFVALTYAGRLVEADELGHREYRKAVADGWGEAEAFLGFQLAKTQVLRGRPVTAARLARESTARYRELQWPILIRITLLTLAQPLALIGAVEEARGALAELDALGLPPSRLLGAELCQARAWTEVASGDLTAARRHLEEGAGIAAENGDLVFESAVLHDLARLGHAHEVVGRLAQLADIIEGDLSSARADHAAAMTGSDPGALETVSQAFETMGTDLLAAEAAADASVAWRQHDESPKAAAAERRSATLAARCQGAMSPALQAVGTKRRGSGS